MLANKEMRAKHFIALILLLSEFVSCNDPVQDTPKIEPRVRAALRSNGADTIQAKVFVEGPDGNSVSGAVVVVRDSRNAVTQLDYNSSSHSYNGILEEPPVAANSETLYAVEIATILSGDIITLSVPYTKLENPPNVTVFQDSDGNSVLHGQSLSSSLPVQIGWADSGEGAVYQVAIKTALRTMYAVSTEARTVTVPANTVQPGSYLLEISAQKTHGDVFFRSAQFYSASFASAPLVSCNVN